MTTPPAPDPKAPTPPAAGDGEAGRIATIDQKIAAAKDEILAAVRSMVGGARQRESEHLTDPGQSKTARAEQAGKGLDEMIRDALKVQEDERAREQADKTREERLGKLEQAAQERPPVDRRRVHRLMGWGDPPQ